ncbi:hypothetical protein CR513_11516, partial [Mucuna pruriens]
MPKDKRAIGCRRIYTVKCKSDGILEQYKARLVAKGDDGIEKLTLKEKLTTQFEMKELGKLKYFLKIEVAYSKQ